MRVSRCLKIGIGLLMLGLASFGESGERDKGVTRCGAKIVRAELGDASVMPRVTVLDNASPWRLKEGEAWTGVNPHEFYFTLETQGKNRPLPQIEIEWPGVKVARVLGAKRISDSATGLTVQMAPGVAPTRVCTTLTYGSVHMAIQHNWEVRRAGPYRDGAWCAKQIQSQLNYLFAAREMCRAMGFTDTRDPGFKGDICLYGFETNFPNGHVDHPPHFHIMLGWPGWEGTQAGHFRLDDNGRITKNEVSSGSGFKTYGHGEIASMLDPDGKIGFQLIIMPDGKGVVMRRAEGQPEFCISADKSEAGAVKSVDVGRREPNSPDWSVLCSVRAEDDPATGVLCITVTERSGKVKRETISYDVDTGAVLMKKR